MLCGSMLLLCIEKQMLRVVNLDVCVIDVVIGLDPKSYLLSEEEAKKKIYNVSCERYFGFGCEIDEETSNKLE
ncbi:multiple organellar RNA editing factor 2, chloroplastic-like protein, partial [Tanacetum coccineum]